MADAWLDKLAQAAVGDLIFYSRKNYKLNRYLHLPWQNTSGNLPNKHDVLPISSRIWNLTLYWSKFGCGLSDKLECLLREWVWIWAQRLYYIFVDVAAAVFLRLLSPQPWPSVLPRRPTVGLPTGREKRPKPFTQKYSCYSIYQV